ncbi:hypothetical protein EOD39_7752 [Acipenser ruthenus]|uniref:Uncharacterized protein n=1 Tax=Acipenser ruthenus TaxID=7906 RepID=A0A444U5X6_ACIRT|nr:hypothetical protein EOD39_7752 [Acipenser ruthenus]
MKSGECRLASWLRRASAIVPAAQPIQSPRTGSCYCPPSPVMVTASSPSTAVQQRRDTIETDPILQLHNSIFEDMKSLIHPITASITTINTRLNDMDKQVSANSARIAIPPGPAFVSAPAVISSSPALPVPTADVPSYNLATAAVNVPQQAPVVRNHTLAPQASDH